MDFKMILGIAVFVLFVFMVVAFNIYTIKSDDGSGANIGLLFMGDVFFLIFMIGIMGMCSFI